MRLNTIESIVRVSTPRCRPLEDATSAIARPEHARRLSNRCHQACRTTQSRPLPQGVPFAVATSLVTPRYDCLQTSQVARTASTGRQHDRRQSVAVGKATFSSFHPPQHPSPPYHLHCFAWFALTTTSLAPQTLIRSHRLFCPHVLCAKDRDLSDNIASTRITSGDNQLGASPARHCDCHGSASHPKSARVVRRTALPPCCDSRLTRSAHRCTASLRN